MAREDPWRRQVDAADQPGLVGVVPDRMHLDLVFRPFQQHRGAPDGQFADAAVAQAAADHDALGVAPFLEPHEAADHRRELLGELLDGAEHHARRLRIAVQHHPVELLLADVLARHFADRVAVAVVVAHALPPVIEDGPERPPARAVADEAALVAQLGVVGVDVHGGELPRAMAGEAGALCLRGRHGWESLMVREGSLPHRTRAGR